MQRLSQKDDVPSHLARFLSVRELSERGGANGYDDEFPQARHVSKNGSIRMHPAAQNALIHNSYLSATHLQEQPEARQWRACLWRLRELSDRQSAQSMSHALRKDRHVEKGVR